jgi:hypothetical protein
MTTLLDIRSFIRAAWSFVGVEIRPSADVAGPTISSGAGVPDAAEPNGSTYMRTNGVDYKRVADAWVEQASVSDAELAAIAGLTSAADRVPYFTGLGTASLATFTAVGRTLVGAATAALQRAALGLDTGDAPTFAGVTAGISVPASARASFLGSSSGTGFGIQRIGATSTEGMELRVFEATISPAAVETNVLLVPANSLVVSAQTNVLTDLTAGGTSVTYGLGVAADPDKYGTPSADGLVKNTKSNFIPAHAFLTAAEQIVLTAAATGGAADGDTALSVGTVRVRVVYWTLKALDSVA